MLKAGFCAESPPDRVGGYDRRILDRGLFVRHHFGLFPCPLAGCIAVIERVCEWRNHAQLLGD